jgi:hypothetical protein
MDFALAGVSLAIQLFGMSIQLCHIYTDSRGAGDTFIRQRILLRVQEQRYRNWGELVGLDKGKFDVQRQPTPREVDLMVDILAQISDLLLAASQLEGKYLKCEKAAQGDIEIQKASDINSARITERQFVRRKLVEEIKARVTSGIKFAIWGKDKFDGFIQDLAGLIDGLESLTGPYQKKLEAMLYTQLLQTESTNGLMELGKATQSTYGILSELATRKASYIELCQRQSNNGGTRRLNTPSSSIFKLGEADIVVNHTARSSGREFGVYQSTTPVMLEWKVALDNLNENEMLQRASDVVNFLSTSTSEGGTHLQRSIG